MKKGFSMRSREQWQRNQFADREIANGLGRGETNGGGTRDQRSYITLRAEEGASTQGNQQRGEIEWCAQEEKKRRGLVEGGGWGRYLHAKRGDTWKIPPSQSGRQEGELTNHFALTW